MPKLPPKDKPETTKKPAPSSSAKQPAAKSNPPSSSSANQSSTKPAQPAKNSASNNGKQAKPDAKPSVESKKKTRLPVNPDRKVVYPEITARICQGDNAITVEQAKSLLGWLEESENVKFKNEFALVDFDGKKIRLTNNVTNRPIYRQIYLTLIQEHLRRKWVLNGEPIIIGRTGLVLNGQHTLISLILADQQRAKEKSKWSEYWKSPVTMEKIVTFGIAEDDRTVNTMDTCKPRTLADVIYRSEYFFKFVARDRKAVSRIADYAIRLLWHRTGASLNAFAPRRTHAESLDFIARHPRLLDAVRHIYEEDGSEGRISKMISPGYAAGILYLMAAATTESSKPDKTGYADVDLPSEEQLDFSSWDQAANFWTTLAAGDLTAVKKGLTKLAIDGLDGLNVRCALLAKAWQSWYAEGRVVPSDLELNWAEKDGEKVLADNPLYGGIDIGTNGSGG